jgi:carboxyl-terminal processing protease
MLQNHHLSHQEFDDQVSKKLLSSYLDFLDFSHIYFTQEDVDKFKEAYETTLDEHILTRNISPALDIYYKYEQRVKERVAYAKQVLETKKFTFDSDRTLNIKREKAPWPKNEAAADALWNDLIEGDLLAERLTDTARLEARKNHARAWRRRLARTWGKEQAQDRAGDGRARRGAGQAGGQAL